MSITAGRNETITKKCIQEKNYRGQQARQGARKNIRMHETYKYARM
jgi:hypothetical protein